MAKTTNNFTYCFVRACVSSWNFAWP